MTSDQGPGTRDQGPGTRDQGPGTWDQSLAASLHGIGGFQLESSQVPDSLNYFIPTQEIAFGQRPGTFPTASEAATYPIKKC